MLIVFFVLGLAGLMMARHQELRTKAQN
jgi:hypothetical protein